MSTVAWDKDSLNQSIHRLKSCLCVGLDTDVQKLPLHLKREDDGITIFNKAIVDATWPYAVAYKVNSAFYEAHGALGWQNMHEIIQYIKSKNRFVILDAKRGDIGNTAELYAKSAFEHLDADAVTVAPYMGKDSVMPFLSYKNKWTILLALTSNPGAQDFQLATLKSGAMLYEEVIRQSAQWAEDGQIMYVTGATRPELLQSIRKIIPSHFLLVPGIGAQGGTVDEVMNASFTKAGDVLINASRSILFASDGLDFDRAAAQSASMLQQQMANFFPKKD